MKKSIVYAVLALVCGGSAIAPAANAATWVMWDGNTPQYVTYVETPTMVRKDISKPVIVEHRGWPRESTKAVVLQRDITVPRWQMTDEALNYEAVEALKHAQVGP